MTNPLYADDPDFYERPGEVVHLITDVHAPQHVVPAMPWTDPDPPTERGRLAALFGEGRRYSPGGRCGICSRPAESWGNPGPTMLLCSYCARASAADETHLARARQPTPSRPRISIREGWEVWAGDAHESQSSTQEQDLSTGHTRAHETRIG